MSEEKKEVSKIERKPIEKTEVDNEFDKKNKDLLKQRKMLIRTNQKYIGYHGSTPFIEVDENWQQLPLERTVLTIPRENLTRMFPLAYLAGKLSAYAQGTKIGAVMILLFILVIANLGLTYFKTDVNSAQIKDVSVSLNSTNGEISNVRTDLSNQNSLLTVIAEKLNVTGNHSVPTVGG